MGPVDDSANDDGPRKASEWLVALKEEPDNAPLRARFDAWLAASQAHAADWAEITRTVDVLGRLPAAHQHEWGAFAAARRAARAAPRTAEASDYRSDATSAAQYAPRPQRHRHSGRITRRRTALRVAMAAIAACLVLFFGPNLVLRLQADHLTETAEQQTLHLADGTTVHLAPQSAINVVYSRDRRCVHLLKGEAFFEVAPEADRHFTVAASGVNTTDLGTAFAVRLDGDGTDIAVRQGLVLVEAAPAISEKLEAGEWVRVLPHGKVERGRTLPDEVAAWTRGQLIAKNRPVSEIVDQLRPYYSGYIILNGAALARQPLTGVYNLSDPVDALRAVARAQGATMREISPWLVVLSGS